MISKNIGHIVDMLSNSILDNMTLDEKISTCKDILHESKDLNYKIVTLKEGYTGAIRADKDTIIIPIEGYFIFNKYIESKWGNAILLTCMEAYETKANVFALYAFDYPSIYVIISKNVDKIEIDEEMAVPVVTDEEREKLSYYCGYDDRYRKVYKAGASTWETEEPNEVLVYVKNKYSNWFKGNIVDLGCGEGRDSLYLASQNCSVIGVDISRVALSKAREFAQGRNLNVKFIEQDVVYLRTLENGKYSLALNMGCLHMITDEEQRMSHIRRVYEILEQGGRFVIAHCKDNWGKGFYSIPNWNELGEMKVGEKILRRIRTEKPSEIELPIIPYKESSYYELEQELISVGFKIEAHITEDTDAFGDTVVIVAQK